MQTDYEILIVGGGLAGATAAFHFSKKYKTLLIEHGSGASLIPVGIAHPLMGKKANPVYRVEEAMPRLAHLLHETELSGAESPIFRPVKDAEQLPYFVKNARLYPHLATFLAESPFPEIAAPLGGLFMPKGFAVPIPDYVQRLKRNFESLTAQLLHFSENENGVSAALSNGHIVSAKKLLLCLGSGYTNFEALNRLNLHQVLGQVISIDAPFLLSSTLSGNGYVAQKENRWHLGSSYEHDFTADKPTMAQTQWILDKTRHLFKTEIPIQKLEMQTGIRITIPRSILPVIAKAPNHQNTWLFTGLGSKGLLMSALLSPELESYILGEKTVPKELSFR